MKKAEFKKRQDNTQFWRRVLKCKKGKFEKRRYYTKFWRMKKATNGKRRDCTEILKTGPNMKKAKYKGDKIIQNLKSWS
jgi:hypothetical protein